MPPEAPPPPAGATRGRWTFLADVQRGDIIVDKEGNRCAVNSFRIGPRGEVLLEQTIVHSARCTPDHPIYTSNKGWTAAKDLEPGDIVLSHDGTKHSVHSVVDRGEVVPVFNISVANHHTYFVRTSNDGPTMLVHNTSPSPSAPKFQGGYLTVSGEDQKTAMRKFFGAKNVEFVDDGGGKYRVVLKEGALEHLKNYNERGADPRYKAFLAGVASGFAGKGGVSLEDANQAFADRLAKERFSERQHASPYKVPLEDGGELRRVPNRVDGNVRLDKKGQMVIPTPELNALLETTFKSSQWWFGIAGLAEAADAIAAVGAARAAAQKVAGSASARRLVGFSEAEARMIAEAEQALQEAGYDTSQLKELVRADMPKGYRGMSLDGGAALGEEAFSSQAMLNHVLEEELIHLEQKGAGLGQQFAPGTAKGLEEAANAARKFPEPK